MNEFWGMKILWIFFWGHQKIGLYLGVISMHFRIFSSGQGTDWGNFFGVAKNSNIFGVLEISDIFLAERYMLGPRIRLKQKKKKKKK